MEEIFDGNIKWANSGPVASSCAVKIFQNAQNQQTLVIVSQDAKGKTGNVVTRIISLANAILNKFEINPENMVLLEHFSEEGGHGEAYDLVTLQWDGLSFHSPQRRRILKKQAEEMAGVPL